MDKFSLEVKSRENVVVETFPSDNLNSQNERASMKPQLLAALGANMGAFAFGTVISWSATGVPSLKTDIEFVGEDGLRDSSSSWISSIITLGALVACVPAGFTADTFGRRKTMIVVTFPLIGSWLLMSFATNLDMFLGGRFVTGACAGTFSLVAPMFLAETAEPRIRGLLTCSYDLMLSFGILFQLIMGTYFSWRQQCLVCGAVPLVILAILYFVPESPRYLLEKGQEEMALKNLAWFRGLSIHSSLVIMELDELNKAIEGEKLGNTNRWKELLKPGTRRAALIGFMLFVCQVMTGFYVVTFYRVYIFKTADSQLDLEDHFCAMVVEAMDVVSSICCLSLVEKCGRKKLMITSEILMALSLIALGFFFFIKENIDSGYATQNLSWLPLAALMAFVGSYSIGMGPIPYNIIPEIFPQKVRGLAGSLLTACMWGLAFIVGRFFEDFINLVGEGQVFWTFGLFCLLGAVYIFYFVPETRGKTLEEIQQFFLTKD